MGESTTIAVDLAKSVFEVAVSCHPGRVTERLRRSIEPKTILAFEAGASDWLPARGLHPGPEPARLQREAADTTAVLPPSKTSCCATCGRSPDTSC